MLEEIIAEGAFGIVFEKISRESVHLIKRNILDSYAGILGSLLDTGMLSNFDALASLAPDEKGINVWGVNRKAHILEALFMNCILARRSDLLNTYLSSNNMGGSHPSDNVSLVLSLADAFGTTGREVLLTTYLAFRLSCDFAEFFHPEKGDFDHDALALLYTSLVASHFLGLSKEKMVQAQRIAGAMGLGTNQAALGVVTEWKHCTYASCAVRGMLAAFLARSGFEGPIDIYEGEAGIKRFVPWDKDAEKPNPELERIIFKRWPALVFVQTAIDAALVLAPQVADCGEIERVEVRTYKKAIEESAFSSAVYHPETRAGITHSMPCCVALALIEKKPEFRHFDPSYFEGSPALKELVPKVKVLEDSGMTALFPDKSPVEITITRKDGSVFSTRLDYPRGDPHDPLTDAEIEEKVLAYAAPALPPEEAKAIIQKIWNLENEQDIRFLLFPLKKRRL